MLTGPSFPPSSGGAADSLVILLHGIGADGNDLINLAPLFAPALPNTAFHSPNAPQRYAEGGFGYQWFPRAALASGGHTAQVEAALNPYIDGLLEEYGLQPSRCVLLGFSQGSIVAMHVAPRRKEALAGVVAFSGAMPTAASLATEKASAPPVLLVHGAEDPVLPAPESEAAAKALEAAGIPATLHILPGLGHSIDQRGIELATEFLQHVLRV